MTKTWLITGGTGFIGKALTQRILNQTQDKIIILSRKAKTLQMKNPIPRRIQYISHFDELSNDSVIDVIVNLAGHPIADSRWTKSIKQEIVNSRLLVTNDLINFISRLKQKPEVLLSGSAVGYYGYGDNQVFDEKSPSQDVFISELCQAWEAKAELAKAYSVRVCLIRSGIVLGKKGGILKKMLLPYQLCLGGPLGAGTQWISWIQMEDYLNLIDFLVENPDLSGPFNATAPNPVTNAVFSETLAKALHRPDFLRMPAFAVRWLFGEMGDALLLHGQKVMPERAVEAGFQFKYAKLKEALDGLV